MTLSDLILPVKTPYPIISVRKLRKFKRHGIKSIETPDRILNDGFKYRLMLLCDTDLHLVKVSEGHLRLTILYLHLNSLRLHMIQQISEFCGKIKGNISVYPFLIHLPFMLIAFKPLPEIHEIFGSARILILLELFLNQGPCRQQGKRTPLISFHQSFECIFIDSLIIPIHDIEILRKASLRIIIPNLLSQKAVNTIQFIFIPDVIPTFEHIPQDIFIVIPHTMSDRRTENPPPCHVYIMIIPLPQTGCIILDHFKEISFIIPVSIEKICEQRFVIFLDLRLHLRLQGVTQLPVPAGLHIDIVIPSLIEIPRSPFVVSFGLYLLENIRHFIYLIKLLRLTEILPQSLDRLIFFPSSHIHK